MRDFIKSHSQYHSIIAWTNEPLDYFSNAGDNLSALGAFPPTRSPSAALKYDIIYYDPRSFSSHIEFDLPQS
jgi:hypothetical protein